MIIIIELCACPLQQVKRYFNLITERMGHEKVSKKKTLTQNELKPKCTAQQFDVKSSKLQRYRLDFLTFHYS